MTSVNELFMAFDIFSKGKQLKESNIIISSLPESYYSTMKTSSLKNSIILTFPYIELEVMQSKGTHVIRLACFPVI